ncbi:MAG: TonB-dependent receptor, partial [Formivibrio sp.]|nr:TonB-dependent receptor [Formivibrio sp.]
MAVSWKISGVITACSSLAILAAVLIMQPLSAQVVGTGSIQGTVLDQQGRVIPDVQVTATDPATGRTVAQATNSAGVYVLKALPPATYTVAFTAKGFAPIQQKSVVVNALTTVGLNTTMKVGSQVEQVVVSSAPPDLETENGTLNTTVPNETYTSLPVTMNGSPKSPLGFLSLVPGSASGDYGVQKINGGPGNTSYLYQNGMPVTTSEMQGDARNVNGSTTTEVVDQFQVVTDGIPAYYSGQGVTNLVLKAGTNSFHGDVYENNRNTVFDAAGFFSTKTPVEHQNEYGFSAGGPFIKNRLFFFMNLDRFRYITENQPQAYTLPTMAERSGDFSQLLTLSTPIVVYDPKMSITDIHGNVIGRCAFGQTISGTICSGTPTNIIPSSRFSSVAKAAQSYLPTLATSASLDQNYYNALQAGQKSSMYFGKLDYTISDRHRLYTMFQTGKIQPLSYYNGGAQLPLPYTSGRKNYQTITIAQLGETWTIAPTLINVFGAQYNQFKTPFVNATSGGNWASKLGITGLPIGNSSDVFPEFDFGGLHSPTGWASNNYSYSFMNNAPNFVYQDNLQWMKGKHSITVGGQFIAQQENTAEPNAFHGFGFSNLATAGFDNSGSLISTSGHSYASFLLGLVNSSSAVDTSVQETGARYKNTAFYIQDDYKVTHRLNLNIGLRYIIPKPFREAHNRNSWFNPNLYNSLVGSTGALQFAGYSATNNCYCDTQVQTHYKTFDPRVGFAYSINSKTVVRGSYTIIHYNGGMLGGNAYSQGISLLGFSASPSFSSPDGGATPAFSLDSGFPSYTHPPFFNSTLNTGYTTNNNIGMNGGSVSYNRPDSSGRSPYTENWNLTISREITPSMTLQVSYAASGSHHIGVNGGVGIFSNQIMPKYLALGSLLTKYVNNGGNGDLSAITAAQAMFSEIKMPYSTFTGSLSRAIRPFPQYAEIGDGFAQFGSASYNSLQVEMQRRMTNGLYFLFSYTWSKSINDTGGI